MTPTLVFDIETVPDIAGLRRLNRLPATLSDADVATWAAQQRRAATGGDFLPLYLQRVVAVACGLREGSTFRVWSLGEASDAEPELIRRFFDGIDRYTPQLVSWNGGGFDLPVLHYRGLIHGVRARRYWDTGDDDREFRYNNYIGRYHTRHLDLMDMLSLYQLRAAAPLDEVARLLGFPGKLGMDGGQVWDAYQRGELGSIRSYCETDVVNTFLVYLRFQLIRGLLTSEQYEHELDVVHNTLVRSTAAHWQEFIGAWRRPAQPDAVAS